MAINPNLNTSLITSITLITSLIFFLITSPTPSLTPHRSLLSHPTSKSSSSSCSSPIIQLSSKTNLINYTNIHTCIFNKDLIFTIPFLITTLILHFYMLIKTAQDHFSNVVTKLCKNLSLSPSMGAVTLLALGNGAPDVFSSMSAFNGGNPRTGFGAILSAGMFVSGLVVGFVGILCGPFSVDPFMFVRDLVFYLVAGFFLFFVYLSGELYFWQAVGFVGFYVFFVGFVFWMDFGSWNVGEDVEKGSGSGLIDGGDGDGIGVSLKHVDGGFKSGVWAVFYNKISKVWEVPVSLLLKLTIPEIEPLKWSRFYQSANIALCPLALLYSCKSFIPMDHPVMFLVPQIRFPLWLVVFFSSSSLATLHYIVEKEPPKTVQTFVILVAFVMSVFWISNIAGELLSCLAALGALLNLPPAILGLTVLAWGNSMGDLVADVAVAKAGQPALAMAGCFAGPMFNMLVGLGTALVIQTGKVYPEAYQLHFHISIVVAFVFLFMSLMGSLLVITWSRFRVPRLWGFCLVGLYVIFIIVSLIIAKFST